jgi:hypothetical protein
VVTLVYFFPFWYVVPRKIWQPCSMRKSWAFALVKQADTSAAPVFTLVNWSCKLALVNNNGTL